MRTINDGFPIKQFKGIDIDTAMATRYIRRVKSYL